MSIRFLNKKAQVSIEVLAILSILVLGSIIFGVYYLSMTRKNIEIANKFDIGPDLYVDNGPVVDGEIIPPEPPPNPEGLSISASSPGNAQINQDFNINVTINSLPTGLSNNTVEVYRIEVKKNTLPTFDCNFGSTNIPLTGLFLSSPINIGNGIEQFINLQNFSCSQAGAYNFTVYAWMDANHEISNPAGVNKQIQAPEELVLALSSPGPIQINTDFNIIAKIEDFISNQNIIIKKIDVNLSGVPTTDCNYGSAPILATGIYPNTQMYNFENDYNLSMPFRCSIIGSHTFAITAGISEDSSDINNDTNSVFKLLVDSSSPRQLLLTLTVIKDEIIMPGFDFNVLANVNYYEGQTIVIKSIEAFRSATLGGSTTSTPGCYYNGQLIPSFSGLTNLTEEMQGNGEDYNLLLNLNCCSPGFYTFKVKAGVKDSADSYQNDDDNKTKETGCEYTGVGTLSNPKQIWTPTDLYCVRYYLDSNFIVRQNIDLDHTTLSNDPSAYWYNDANGWESIAGLSCSNIYNHTYFSGDFNGNNKSINNMYENYRAPYAANSVEIGLFKENGYGAKIHDLEMNTSTVLAAAAAGALVGVNNGILEDCKISDSSITAFSNVGGLAGVNATTGKIIHSSSLNNKIIGEEYPLFPVPYVEGYPTSVGFGGLVGSNGGIIEESYSISDISGTTDCGGLVGFQRQQDVSGSSGPYDIPIKNCYSKGNVIGESAVGGLIGKLYASRYLGTDESITGITDSYSTTIVKGAYSNSPEVGGLIGHVHISGDSDFDKIVRNCVWDIIASEQPVNCPDCPSTGMPGYYYFGYGKTTEEMKDISTYNQQIFLPGYDWIIFYPWSISLNDPEKIWNINELNEGYPYLTNNLPE